MPSVPPYTWDATCGSCNHGQGTGGDGTDKFRIRIDGGPRGLLYDNEWTKGPNDDATTALGGGSVQIKTR